MCPIRNAIKKGNTILETQKFLYNNNRKSYHSPSLFILNITLSRPPPSYWFPVTPAAGEFYPPDINKSIRRNGVLKRVRVTDWRVATRLDDRSDRGGGMPPSRDDQSLGQAFFPFSFLYPMEIVSSFDLGKLDRFRFISPADRCVTLISRKKRVLSRRLSSIRGCFYEFSCKMWMDK